MHSSLHNIPELTEAVGRITEKRVLTLSFAYRGTGLDGSNAVLHWRRRHCSKHVCLLLVSYVLSLGLAFGQARIDPQLPPGSQPLTRHRVLHFLPDYVTVESGKLPNRHTLAVAPLSKTQKLRLFMGQSLDPSVVVIAGALAGIQQGGNLPPSYGQGGSAYFKRFGAMDASIATGNLLSLTICPVVFHQDPRYFRKGEGPVRNRIWYAITRVFVAQSDQGRSEFNYSQLAGFAASTALANAYYPDGNRTASQNAIRFGIGVVASAGINVLREFHKNH